MVELLVTSDGSIGLNNAARFLPSEGLLVCVVLEYFVITMCQPPSTWKHMVALACSWLLWDHMMNTNTDLF